MPVEEITRDQTIERAKLVNSVSYDVSLDVTGGDEVFGSVSVITFSCVTPGASTYVDLIANAVHEIVFNGTVLEPATAWINGRIALSGLLEHNELRVSADCSYANDGTAMHRSVDSADGKVYVYTALEPADARRVYANFEQPDLKAAFTLHVIAPAHWTVFSNQPTPEPAPRTGATAVWDFAPTPRISTYLTTVVAGEYVTVRDSHTSATGQVIPLALACRASFADYLDPEELFELTKRGLDFFTELFGTDYPFAKYDQVFVAEFDSAVENVGCVVITEELLFRSRVTDLMYERRTNTLLHEMAHMWFGDLVTMQWWDDLWLNESFAEFCATLACAESTRFSDAWATFAYSRKTWGLMQDRLPTTHPIAAYVATVTEAESNFDGISYAKGASVLKQLVAYVGRDNFFTAIKGYFDHHAWGNTTLADLLEALEAGSGKSLSAWSTAWLEAAGPNTLRSEFEVDDQGGFTSFAVLQEAPPSHPTLRPHRISIGLYDRVEGVLVRTRRAEVEVATARADVNELVGEKQPDLLVLNDDDFGYAAIRFDARSLDTLAQSIGEITDPLARAVCWVATLDMANQAELSLSAFVRMVTNAMESEPSIAVVQTLHHETAQVIAHLGDPRDVPKLKEHLAAAAARLLSAAEPGSDHQLAWAELLGWTATSDEQIELVAALLDASTVVPGLVVDTELRWTMLGRLVTTGRAAADDIDTELQRDPTDSGERRAATCRAAVPDARHKEAAWKQLAETDELGVQGVLEVAEGFTQSEHAALLVPFAQRYFDVIQDIWSSHGDHFRVVLAQALFPTTAPPHELIQQIDSFLAAQQRDRGLERVLVEFRDVAERALVSRALQA
ncbi:MAG TPA: aminopeptidase N [Acidimicrobiales bacterium]|nr:aminopeptidase N [Acidimicrobiales bacterium]